MEDNEDYDIITNLSCPNCHSAVDVYHPSEQLIKEYKKHEKSVKWEDTYLNEYTITQLT